MPPAQTPSALIASDRATQSACRACDRLVQWHEEKRLKYPDYHLQPVLAFGPSRARLLIVGLAPGLHGAGRTGRPFTRDASSRFLFAALHRAGFASSPDSLGPGDGMKLIGTRLTNAVRCLPPQNQPTPAEFTRCAPFLDQDIAQCQARRRQPVVMLALGKLAHDALRRQLGVAASDAPFGHGAEYLLPGSGAQRWLLASYHPSLQNTNTGRLTPVMFDQIFERVQVRLR